MRIVRHRLHDGNDKPDDFQASSGKLTPTYLVMHYTAGSSLQGAVDFMRKPSSKAAAHLAIGRDGKVIQLIGFDRVAWHAGKSRWRGLVGLNKHSIGIELENAGPLEWRGASWRTWFGHVIDGADVMEAAHKHDGIDRGWQRYTDIQLNTVIDVAQTIVGHYELLDVIGHNDIAPLRKQDLGPAFPMESFRSAVMGRSDEEFELYRSTAKLNVREGPGTQYDKPEGSPIAKGTTLRLLSEDCSWCYVEVLDKSGDPELSGWVHGDCLTSAQKLADGFACKLADDNDCLP